MSIDERLERLVGLAEVHDRQIGELRDTLSQHSAEHDRQIGELRDLLSQQSVEHDRQISELREANALLVRIVSQQQDELQEYKRSTNEALDRIDRTLKLLFGQQNNGNAN